jgi:NADPH:quinone reductase-like Zn-dependent oxidoreductase
MSSPELPNTHRALVLSAIGEDPTVQTVPVPECTPGSAIVRISVAGVLPYARAVYGGERAYPMPTPLVIGSSAVGRVVRVAPDATTLAVGQLVFVDSYIRGRDNKGISFLSVLHEGMVLLISLDGAWPNNIVKALRQGQRSSCTESGEIPRESYTLT